MHVLPTGHLRASHTIWAHVSVHQRQEKINNSYSFSGSQLIFQDHNSKIRFKNEIKFYALFIPNSVCLVWENNVSLFITANFLRKRTETDDLFHGFEDFVFTIIPAKRIFPFLNACKHCVGRIYCWLFFILSVNVNLHLPFLKLHFYAVFSLNFCMAVIVPCFYNSILYILNFFI